MVSTSLSIPASWALIILALLFWFLLPATALFFALQDFQFVLFLSMSMLVLGSAALPAAAEFPKENKGLEDQVLKLPRALSNAVAAAVRSLRLVFVQCSLGHCFPVSSVFWLSQLYLLKSPFLLGVWHNLVPQKATGWEDPYDLWVAEEKRNAVCFVSSSRSMKHRLSFRTNVPWRMEMRCTRRSTRLTWGARLKKSAFRLMGVATQRSFSWTSKR